MDHTPTESAETFRQIIITIPGFWTFGAWQRKVKTLLEISSDLDGVLVVNFRTLHLGLKGISDLIGKVGGVADRFFSEYQNLQSKYRNCPISVIAHSLGTRVIHDAVSRYPIRLKHLILAAPVLPAKASFASDRVERVLIDIARTDLILLVGLILFGRGEAGLRGLTLEGSQVTTIRRAFYNHKGFFSELHVTRAWVPFLLGQKPPQFNEAANDRPVWWAKPFIAAHRVCTVLAYLVLLTLCYAAYAAFCPCPWYPQFMPNFISQRLIAQSAKPLMVSRLAEIQPPVLGGCRVEKVREVWPSLPDVQWVSFSLQAPPRSNYLYRALVKIEVPIGAGWVPIHSYVEPTLPPSVWSSRLNDVDGLWSNGWQIDNIPAGTMIRVIICARQESARNFLKDTVLIRACSKGRSAP